MLSLGADAELATAIAVSDADVHEIARARERDFFARERHEEVRLLGY